MASPSVLVAMPTRGYAYAPSVLRAAALARRWDHELALEVGQPIELMRSRIAARFLESTADYLLTIDDDIIGPDDAVDRLLALDAPVATAPCPIAMGGRIISNVKAAGSDDFLIPPATGVIELSHTGLGFTLIHRDVFARIRRPWFQFAVVGDSQIVGEDMWFSNGVTKAGLRILCDCSLRCHHFKNGLDLLKLARW